MPLSALHRVPESTPHVETQLSPGELIVAIEIPLPSPGIRSGYLKVRDRTSFAFALASVAVAIDIRPNGLVRDARVAVAGVATTPWRLPQVEARLNGQHFDAALCRRAAAAAADGAVARRENGYKIELLKNTVARGLEQIGGLA